MNRVPTSGSFETWLNIGDKKSIGEALAAAHPADTANALLDLDDASAWRILLMGRLADAGPAFGHLPMEVQARLIEQARVKDAARLLDRVAADERADLFKALDEPLRATLLPHLSLRQRLDTERLVSYDEHTVGAVMSTEFAAVPGELTVRDSFDFIRDEAPRKETVYAIYVVDELGRLAGVVSLEDLLTSDQERRMDEIMDRDVKFVRADEPRTAVAEMIRTYDFLALPVINGGDRLAGIVTVDDVLDVEEEEATEDFHKMAPVGAIGTGIKEAGLALLYRARAPWLLVLVFMNILSGAGIAYFEDTLAAMISLAFFLPLLIASGGNAGSQSATLMVRALATGDVRLSDWVALLAREILVSVALGVTMGVAVAFIASVRAPEIGVIVALSMVVTVLFGSLVGLCLPFLLTRLKFDPAMSSSPLVTSVADIGGVLIYFGIATWWLGDIVAVA
jgi:magnesium transporter